MCVYVSNKKSQQIVYIEINLAVQFRETVLKK